MTEVLILGLEYFFYSWKLKILCLLHYETYMLSSKRYVVTLKVKIVVNGFPSKSEPQAVVFVWSRHFIYLLSWSVFLLSFCAIFCTGTLLGSSLALQCTNWACAVKSCQFRTRCVCGRARGWARFFLFCVCVHSHLYIFALVHEEFIS